MSTEQILDLIINYAYTRKEEIEKHKVLLGNDQSNNNPSRQIDDEKIKEIDNWIKFLIDVKNGKLDLSKTRSLKRNKKNFSSTSLKVFCMCVSVIMIRHF